MKYQRWYCIELIHRQNKKCIKIWSFSSSNRYCIYQLLCTSASICFYFHLISWFNSNKVVNEALCCYISTNSWNISFYDSINALDMFFCWTLTIVRTKRRNSCATVSANFSFVWWRHYDQAIATVLFIVFLNDIKTIVRFAHEIILVLVLMLLLQKCGLSPKVLRVFIIMVHKWCCYYFRQEDSTFHLNITFTKIGGDIIIITFFA